MKKLLVLIGVLFLLACSEKAEEEKAMYQINASFQMNDPEFWPGTQQVLFGLFEPGTTYPSVYTTVNKTATKIQANLSQVAEGSYMAKLYIAENNQYVATLHTSNEFNISEDLSLEEASFSFIQYARIQEQVLNTCTICHGASTGSPAADLILLDGQSYANLVLVSAKNANLYRVKPNAPDESFLINVIKQEAIPMDHSASTSLIQDDIDLITHWIELGATQE